VALGKGGKILVHCHAGCTAEQIVGAVGLSLTDLWASETSRDQPPRTAQIEAIYDYQDEARRLLFQVVRYQPKAFRQRQPDGQGGWKWNLQGVRRVLYGLPVLAAAARDRPVFVVEGEKDADNLKAQGLVATTNPGGAGKWRPQYAESLRGRPVILLPDNDALGKSHMEEVARALLGVAASLKLLELADRPPKGDVSDWLAAGGTATRLLQLADQAEAWVAPPPSNEPEALARDAVDLANASGSSPGSSARLTTLATVSRRDLRWFWPGWIPLGKITVLDGDPGLGKSTLLLDLAARASRHLPMPDGQPSDGGPSLLLSAEDDLEDTVRPRLEAAGANLSLVHHFSAVESGLGLRSPVLPEDLGVLAATVKEQGIRLVILDPFFAYLGEGLDTSRDHDMRRVLFALGQLAAQAGCAIVLVRHLNKGNNSKAVYRGGGSIGITAAARMVLLVAADPYDSETRVVAVAKSNVSARHRSLSYRLQQGDQGLTIAWRGETDWTADALLETRVSEEDRSALDEACDFLGSVLENGPVASDDLKAQAQALGLTERTPNRAKKTMGVKSKKVKGPLGPQWVWEKKGEGKDQPSGKVANPPLCLGNLEPGRE
jgi:hypothetical protein